MDRTSDPPAAPPPDASPASPAAERTFDPPSPRRRLLERVAWCVAAAVVATCFAAAVRIERWFGDAGAPSVTFDVAIPHEAAGHADADQLERTWRARLADHRVRTELGPAPDDAHLGVRVEVVGAHPVDAPVVLRALIASARLELRPVMRDRVMEAWYAAVERDGVDIGDARAEVEHWQGPDGDPHGDAYLHAPALADVRRAAETLAHDHPLPAGTSLAFEYVTPPPDARDPRPYHRSYLLGDDLILGNDHIAGAEVVYDPITLAPQVLVTLTAEGTTRFADATARLLGEKLAIVLDGAVSSAPVVMGEIRDGRVTITMGGTDPRRQEEDARALAATLRSSGRLPPGMDARLVGTSAGSGFAVWPPRVAFGVLAGAVAWLLALFSARRRWFVTAPSVHAPPDLTRPAAAAASTRGGGAASGTRTATATLVALAVTLGLPALLWYAGRELIAPGVDRRMFEDMLAMSSGGDPAQLGIFALGITPVVSAFLLTELVAAALGLLVPGIRERRLGTAAERRPIDRIVWALAAAFAFFQAYMIYRYLDDIGGPGPFALLADDTATRIAFVLTLVGGVMVHVVAAELISRRGLCNGYLALLGAGAVGTLVDIAKLPPPGPPDLAGDFPTRTFLVATVAVTAFAAFAISRLRSTSPHATSPSRPAGTAPAATPASARTAIAPGPRLPYTGAVPATMVRGGLGLLAIGAMWSPWFAGELQRVYEHALVLELAALFPLTALILWTARRAWTVAGVVATAAFLAVLVVLPFWVAPQARLMLPLADGVLLGILAAELVTGLRARRALAAPTTVLVVHDVFRADEASDRLAAAGIPHAVLGARARAVLRLVGPYVPVELAVPAEHAAAARTALSPDVEAPAAATPRAP